MKQKINPEDFRVGDRVLLNDITIIERYKLNGDVFFTGVLTNDIRGCIEGDESEPDRISLPGWAIKKIVERPKSLQEQNKELLQEIKDVKKQYEEVVKYNQELANGLNQMQHAAELLIARNEELEKELKKYV